MTTFGFCTIRVDHPVAPEVTIEDVIRTYMDAKVGASPIVLDHVVLVAPTVEPKTWTIRCSCGSSAVVASTAIEETIQAHFMISGAWPTRDDGTISTVPSGIIAASCTCIPNPTLDDPHARVADPSCPTHRGY